MRKLNYLLISLILVYVPFLSVAQSIRKAIQGEWMACGKVENVLFSDTLTLHNDTNYIYRTKCCDCMQMLFSKRHSLKVSDTKQCTEPGRVMTYNAFTRYSISQVNGKWYLTLPTKKRKFKYQIAQLVEHTITTYPFQVKKLKLIKCP